MSYAASIEPRYIQGTPYKNFDETLADNCLSLPRAYWDGKTVELIENEQTLEAQYTDQGCAVLPIKKMIEFINVDPLWCIPCIFPLLAYRVTEVITMPFDLFGKCMKDCSLERDPNAKAYNQMAADHLQTRITNSITIEEIDELKTKLETLTSQSLLTKAIYDLVLDQTKNHPTDLSNHTLKFNKEKIDLVLRPVIENACTINYDISTPFNSISGFPTTRIDLSKRVQLEKKAISKLEHEIREKEARLKGLHGSQKNFINDVQGLLNRGLYEAVPSSDEATG